MSVENALQRIPRPYTLILKSGFYSSLFFLPVLLGSVHLWQFSFATFLLASSLLLYWVGSLKAGGLSQVISSPIDKWIGWYLLVLGVSFITSKIHSLSFEEVYKTLGALAFFWATRCFIKDRSSAVELARFFMVLATGLCLYGLLQLLGGLPKEWWDRPYFLSSTYVNHNHFAGFLIATLPLSLALAFGERQQSKKILYVFLCSLIGAGFIFTISRGGYLSLSVALFVMLFLLYRQKVIQSGAFPIFIFIVLVSGMVMALGVKPLEDRISDIHQMTEVEALSLQYRSYTWQGAVRMFVPFILTGSGPGTFGFAFLKYRPEGFALRPVHAHNDYIELLTDCGIAAIIVLGLLLAALFRRGYRIVDASGSRMTKCLGSASIASIVGLLVHGFFDFNFHIPANWVYAAVVAAFLLSLNYDEPPASSTTEIQNWTIKLMPFMVVFTCVMSLWLGLAHQAFFQAGSYLRDKKPQLALEAVQRSISIYPWHAESHYLKGFIRSALIARSGESGQYEELQSIVQDYDKAIALNAFEPYYNLYKARISAAFLFIQSPEKLLAIYDEVIRKDPQNAKLAYLCAKDLLSGNTRNDPRIKIQAQKILKKALRQDPAYSEEIYSLLWNHEKNISNILALHELEPRGLKGFVLFLDKQDLWRYYRKYRAQLEGIDLEENDKLIKQTQWNEVPEATYSLNDFFSLAKQAVHFENFFHTNGALMKDLDFHNQLKLLKIDAKSSGLNGHYPVVLVKIDGKVQDVHYMDSETNRTYPSLLKAERGKHRLSIEYINDRKNESGSGEDRNIWIQALRLYEQA